MRRISSTKRLIDSQEFKYLDDKLCFRTQMKGRLQFTTNDRNSSIYY
jgi:hypothetical protein